MSFRYMTFVKNYYLWTMRDYPLLNKMTFAGTMYGLGDALYQKIEGNEKLDWKRILKMSAFGAAVFGPLGHYWYNFLDHRYPTTTTRHILTKVAFDQLVFAPPYYTLFFFSMSMWEGRGFEGSKKEVKEKILHTLVCDYAVWPGIQWINFKWLPSSARVLFVSGVSVGWNAFLSKMQHNPPSGGHEKEHKTLNTEIVQKSS
eukprot:TRINITY_DN12713_c0_g1_i1.p1 TRINITY_DN12713_c0_g1~~TRINITY_DN12713_c0_g1_i1.p1  ORF type:complete len:201 (+),score=54.29 TRINITY_DN12713_c0_g1_i1:305-907(+)